jgi:hypothetical protein
MSPSVMLLHAKNRTPIEVVSRIVAINEPSNRADVPYGKEGVNDHLATRPEREAHLANEFAE